MKKSFLLSFFVVASLHATSITTLLQALSKRPEFQIDSLMIKQTSFEGKKISAKLWPKVTLFASIEQNSIYKPLGVLLPNESAKLLKNKNAPQPFSKTIIQEGIKVTWPIFVKSLFSLKEQAKYMAISARQKRKLNLLQKEAMVVGAAAQLNYIDAMLRALSAKERSIKESKKKIALGVKIGQMPYSKLLLINTKLNEIKINQAFLKTNRLALLAKLQDLTGIKVRGTIPLRLKRHIKKGEFFALKPLQSKLRASKKAIEAAKGAFYPKVVVSGIVVREHGNSINTDTFMHKNLAQIKLSATMPLFDKEKQVDVQIAKINYLKNALSIKKMRHSLKVEAKKIKSNIALLQKSARLAKKSIKQQQELLKMAKVAFLQGSITQEEYLRYEDALFSAKADFAKIIAQIWQNRVQLAVIYGDDLKGVVR